MVIPKENDFNKVLGDTANATESVAGRCTHCSGRCATGTISKDKK